MIETCDNPKVALLPIKDAISAMLSAVSPVKTSENLPLKDLLGRVVFDDIISPIDVPPADNSAMDGYAMSHSDLSINDSLQLVGTALAGQPFSDKVAKGQCVRIMTGAILPKGVDAVVMQENTEVRGDSIVFKQRPKLGNSVRKKGEDIQQGQVVVSKGTQLSAAHLALLASVGIDEVSVLRKLKVALIATGDELTSPGQPLSTGAIYESNRYALNALLTTLPVSVTDLGIVKDTKDSLRATFNQADLDNDLVISCGGVSVGEADYVKDILTELGQVNFWKVAIKPGKPFAFGRLNHAWFCGLPGNPVSSYVTFEQLVVPVIHKLVGQVVAEPSYFVARAASLINKRPGRADYQRGIFFRDEQGELWVKPNGKQGSGIMSSIAQANCYMVLAQDEGNIQQGERVKIQPF